MTPETRAFRGTTQLSVTLPCAVLWRGLAGYFRFAFRLRFFAAFFFDVLRAAFFAAILRTVVAFFLLFGMNNSLQSLRIGTIRTFQKRQEYEEVRLAKQYPGSCTARA